MIIANVYGNIAATIIPAAKAMHADPLGSYLKESPPENIEPSAQYIIISGGDFGYFCFSFVLTASP